MWPRSGVLDFSKKPRGAKKGEIPFVRSRMSTCFRRNFQISGFFRESGFSLVSRSKNQKSPDFSGSFKSNERKLRCVKISAQSDENCGFFITSKVSTHFAKIQKHRLRNPKTGSFLSKRKGDQPPQISAQSDY